MASEPLVFDERSKILRDGTYRLVAPARTADRVWRQRRRIGITRVGTLTGLDRIGIPVVAAYRPSSRSLSVSMGKGLTLDAARASALMEATELHSAERVHRRPIRASYESLLRRGATVADVRRLPNLRGARRFRRDDVNLWSEARLLATGEPVWIPYELVHVDYRVPFPPYSGRFAGGSTGLASGNTIAEALLHGLCEVVESDATTLWFLQTPRSMRSRRIALDTVDDPGCRSLLERYAAASISVGVWETTTDIGIPAFLCQIADLHPSRARPIGGAHGMGCHPDRNVALGRALSEAAQCRLTWISGARDDARPADFAAADDALAGERASLAWNGHGRSFHDGPHFVGRSLADDLRWLQSRLAVVDDADVLWIDLTHPEIGIPVVRIVIPGLEPNGVGAGSDHYVPGPRAAALVALR